MQMRNQHIKSVRSWKHFGLDVLQRSLSQQARHLPRSLQDGKQIDGGQKHHRYTPTAIILVLGSVLSISSPQKSKPPGGSRSVAVGYVSWVLGR